MREKSKYFELNTSTRSFIFKLFISLQRVFLSFHLIFRKYLV